MVRWAHVFLHVDTRRSRWCRCFDSRCLLWLFWESRLPCYQVELGRCGRMLNPRLACLIRRRWRNLGGRAGCRASRLAASLTRRRRVTSPRRTRGGVSVRRCGCRRFAGERPESTGPAGECWCSRNATGNGQSVDARTSGLEIGQTLPELTILDADGQPFPLARLRGRYSVLVFGCLT